MGKGSSGSNTETVTQNSSPPPQVLAAYQQALTGAQNASSAPYQPYNGSTVAPFSDLQTSAFQGAYAPSSAAAPAYSGAASAYGGAGTALTNTGTAYNAAAGAYGNAGTAYGTAGSTYGDAATEIAGANPTYQAAANAYSASTAPLWGNTMQYSPNSVNQYYSPYQSDVVNSTAQQFANTNAIQNAGVVGNAAAEGAWGGDRSAVAQAVTAGQQQQAEAPVLAGLENTGFQTAQGEFNTQQAAQLGANEAQGWLGSQAGAGLSGIASGEVNAGQALSNVGAGYSNIGAGESGIGAGYSNIGSGYTNAAGEYGNIGSGLTTLGNSAANTATTQEGLLSSLGSQEQAETQAGLNIPYEQYTAGQAYPFQTAQYYTNAAEGIGSQEGGTSSTTSPGPSTASELAGLGIGGVGLLGATGAFGSAGWLTALLARGGKVDPTKGAMPKAPEIGARPMSTELRFIPHKLHMAEGGIIGYQPNEVQHFDTGGMPISPIQNTQPISPTQPQGASSLSQSGISGISVPDVSVSVVPQSQQHTMGAGPPKPPQPAPQQPTMGSELSAVGSALKGSGIFGNSGNNNFQMMTPTATYSGGQADYGGGGDFAMANTGGLYRSGGGIRGYDDGGATDAPTVDLPDVGVSAPAVDPGWQKVMPTIEQYESGNKNVMQTAYNGVGINPSTGTHTPPSTAQGYLQITNPTWRGEAPKAGVDVSQYPTAMSAPRGIQEKVGEQLYHDYGTSPWAPYNPRLAAALGESHPSAPAPAQSPRETQLAQADTGTMTDASPDMGIAGTSSVAASPARSQGMIESAANGNSHNSLTGMGVDPWLALMMAGFATAAGNSPFPLQNIGAGFLEGAKSIQQQRLQGPEMALKSAQAQEAAANAHLATIKANVWDGVLNPYQGNANPSPQSVASSLDGVVTKAQKEVANGPPAPAPAVAPGTPLPPQGAPATGTPAVVPTAAAAEARESTPAAGTAPAASPQTTATPEMQQLHQQYQAQISAIDQQIAAVQRNLGVYQTPQMQRLALVDGTVAQSRNTLLQQLNGLQEQRLGYVTHDPLAAVATAGATASAQENAKVGPETQLTQNQEQIKAGYGAQTQQVTSDQERIDKELRPAADKANDTVATANLLHDVVQNGTATGWGADFKLEAGRILKSLGASDENISRWAGTNVPSGQEAEKLFLQQSAQAVRQMGAREPGSVISLFAHAYPSLETDPHAIQLMENVLSMQARQAQDFYNMARTQHTQAVSDMRAGKPYVPMDALEQDFRGGAHSQENYLRAAQIMSGDSKGYQGLTAAQQRQVISLVPSGSSLLLPNGQTVWRQ